MTHQEFIELLVEQYEAFRQASGRCSPSVREYARAYESFYLLRKNTEHAVLFKEMAVKTIWTRLRNYSQIVDFNQVQRVLHKEDILKLRELKAEFKSLDSKKRSIESKVTDSHVPMLLEQQEAELNELKQQRSALISESKRLVQSFSDFLKTESVSQSLSTLKGVDINKAREIYALLDATRHSSTQKKQTNGIIG